MQTFFQNRDEQVSGDGAPDLGAHRVGRGAVKDFDARMLLDPFEEEFDLPAAAIELGDGQRRDGEVVGQEDQPLAGLGIAITDAPQRDGIILLGLSGRSARRSGRSASRWFDPPAGSNGGRSGSFPWRG